MNAPEFLIHITSACLIIIQWGIMITNDNHIMIDSLVRIKDYPLFDGSTSST